MGESFPAKNTEDSLEKELEYCKQLISVIKEKEELCSYPKVQEKLNLLEESVSDDMQHLETSKDADAKTGHKTADTSFFGYKTHIAMTEERIITAATITSGEKTDGKELPELVKKSRSAGMKVEAVIGDKAYSDKKNIDAAKEGGYELIAKLNPVITQGNRTKEDKFEILNLYFEGIDLASSYRAQFTSYMEQNRNDPRSVIKYLKEQNKEKKKMVDFNI